MRKKRLFLFNLSIISNFFVTSWTVAHQASLSMGFSRQECWCGLPFLSPGDLPDLRIKNVSPAWQVDSLPLSHQEKTKGEVKEEEVFIKWQSWEYQQTDPQKLTKKKWTLTQWHTRDSKCGNLLVGIIQWERKLTLVTPVTVFLLFFVFFYVQSLGFWDEIYHFPMLKTWTYQLLPHNKPTENLVTQNNTYLLGWE